MLRQCLLFVVVVGAAAPAGAQTQVQQNGPEHFPGKNELALHMGVASGFTGTTPGGFKISADFSHMIQESGNVSIWLNFGVNTVLGLGGGCGYDRFGGYNCGYGGYGYTFEPQAGIKVKFTTPIPLVPYVKADGTLLGVLGRFCGDNGLGFGARVGGGANYYLLRNLGVGIELTTAFGPAFYNGLTCQDPPGGAHIDFFAEFDFSVGAEFIF